ncbi:MAG: type 4a pilus biogenesis protein PilO [Candidatus Omnitrophica bacterium]|nr:type 4a pilus biogenesis protein PilO [Candidatus Omnitrophota bacterium]
MPKFSLKKIFINNRFIIITGILFIILIFSLIFIYIPLAKSLGELNARYNQQYGELLKVKEQIALSDKIKARIISYSEDELGALDELTKVASTLGINLDSVKPEKIISLGEDYQILPIAIESVCDFKALGSFLGALEGLEKSVVVLKQLEITRAEESLPNLKASLELGIYLRSD